MFHSSLLINCTVQPRKNEVGGTLAVLAANQKFFLLITFTTTLLTTSWQLYELWDAYMHECVLLVAPAAAEIYPHNGTSMCWCSVWRVCSTSVQSYHQRLHYMRDGSMHLSYRAVIVVYDTTITLGAMRTHNSWLRPYGGNPSKFKFSTLTRVLIFLYIYFRISRCYALSGKRRLITQDIFGGTQ